MSVDTSPDDPRWDAFVARTPGGHHAQTSLWAQVKAVLGWDAARLIVHDGSEPVAGVQLLIRDISRFGRVAFAPRGPIIASGGDRVLGMIHAAVMEFARSERIRYLKVQPPTDRHDLVPELRSLGWTPSALEAAPSATVRVNLTASEEQLLASMRKTTRNHLRKAQRKGLRVRIGDEGDLPAYYRVVEATSKRQGFAPYPSIYYETMFRAFANGARARLLLTELEDRLLSTALLIGFGDSVTYKMGGWSGERAPVTPNEPTHWTGLRWAKENGYGWYDFDGIAKPVAVAIDRDGVVPEAARQGVSNFKLGFGGEVELFPEALDHSPYGLLRPFVRVASPRLHHVRWLAHRALGRG